MGRPTNGPKISCFWDPFPDRFWDPKSSLCRMLFLDRFLHQFRPPPPNFKQHCCCSTVFNVFSRNPASRIGTPKSIPKMNPKWIPKVIQEASRATKLSNKSDPGFKLEFLHMLERFSKSDPKINQKSVLGQRPPRGLWGAIL